jgi:enterochelin esterase-like enzyme
MRLSLLLVGLVGAVLAQEPEFPLTADSKVQEGVAKGTMVKGGYLAGEESVFPGTQREYQLYLPAGFDKAKPAAFMVFQDGVIYQAPVVFDNLIAKGDIPPLVGVFIKPGVVPAANENALPRFNRSFEYDSVTPLYSRFLIDEFLPAVEQEHGIRFSTNPNEAAIAGNSSGGICAFMVAWHRPDRFRRVFTGVGTYVGIHGADQLPVWVRKFEPKPIRVFLQSGTGDNNLYCGDWWMANQMMERSLTWAGYEVKHAWGEGGHNQKHASQVFPEAMRWLWREWKTEIEVRANVKGESKWKGYEVVGEGEWEQLEYNFGRFSRLAANASGTLYTVPVQTQSGFATSALSRRLAGLPTSPEKAKGVWKEVENRPYAVLSSGIASLASDGKIHLYEGYGTHVAAKCAVLPNGRLMFGSQSQDPPGTMLFEASEKGPSPLFHVMSDEFCLAVDHRGRILAGGGQVIWVYADQKSQPVVSRLVHPLRSLCFSPDNTLLYYCHPTSNKVFSCQIQEDNSIKHDQFYAEVEKGNLDTPALNGLCVDKNGWLYAATALGIQVLDQAGRVNFVLPTPQVPLDVCFGGKDLGELFIACGDTIYKRATKARGVVSGQMAPIKPAPPKL